MESKLLMSFRIVKTKDKNGQTVYGLVLSNEDGSARKISNFSTIEKLLDGIYDYFDCDLYYG
ncbi:MAG: hypothetical protein JW891_04380 [Candidatus Lokiarchaeota archaeon]|nr:hypothetical protein [Candidatus Lokiarchaeota archaeon]